MKFIRRQLWFLSSFFKKYKNLIFAGIFFSVVLSIIWQFTKKYLPTKKEQIRIGIIGQYQSGELPPPIIHFLDVGLTKILPNKKISANLAKDWQLSDSGKEYLFTLNDELFWSNDEPITAQDLNLNIPSVETEIIDDQSIRFILPAKFAPFPSVLTFPITSKEGILPSPFQIKVKQKSSGVLTQITLTNQTSETRVDIFPSATQAIVAYKLGQLDVVLNLPETALTKNLSNYGILEKSTGTDQIVILLLNHKDPILQSKSVRQGISYALKDKSFNYQRALTTISPDSWAFYPLVKTYDYNQSHAEKLIKEELPENISILNLELATTPELLPIAEKIVESLTAQYLNLKIKVVPSKPESFQLFLTSFDIPTDPDQYAFWHSTQANNLSSVSSEKLDKLLEDGRTELDEKERKKIYNEFQRVFTEELPAITLFHLQYVNLVRNQKYLDIIKNNWPTKN